jgi:LysR family transcriptional regulator (chromosome initiation inhibitor)
VSQRIRVLEDRLGRRLLIRSTPVRATPEGEAVVRFGRHVGLFEAEALRGLGIDEPGESPRLALAINADSLATWFLPALARFTAAHDVQVEILRADQEETHHLLESGTVIAAITSRSQASSGCSSSPLGSLEYRAVASRSFCETWSGEDLLRRAPRVDFDHSDTLQHAWLREQGLDPTSTPRHFVPSAHELAQAVGLGIGWAMVPTQHLDANGADELVELGGPGVSTPLFWQCWRHGIPLLEDLTAEVLAEARNSLVHPGPAVASRP